MFITYYIVCIIYCFLQLFRKFKHRYDEGPTGNSPELDTIMVLMMAWVLAPVDASITWIKMVKDAEQAKINQSKMEFYDDRLKEMLKK